MSENPFKKHSINEIEECISNALTTMTGQQIKVGINGVQLTNENLFSGTCTAEFKVNAVHTAEWALKGLDLE